MIVKLDNISVMFYQLIAISIISFLPLASIFHSCSHLSFAIITIIIVAVLVINNLWWTFYFFNNRSIFLVGNKNAELFNLRYLFSAGMCICKLACQVCIAIFEESFFLGILLKVYEYLNIGLWYRLACLEMVHSEVSAVWIQFDFQLWRIECSEYLNILLVYFNYCTFSIKFTRKIDLSYIHSFQRIIFSCLLLNF